MYIESVPNRSSPPAVLLRESFREGGRVKKRTVANLSDLPEDVIAGFRAVLKGEAVGRDQAIIDPEASLVLAEGRCHGATAAVVGSMRQCGLERLLGGRDSRENRVVMAMVADRLLHGDSKLATARHCHTTTAGSSLGAMLGLEDLTEQECYRAMDWLLERQPGIERRLAKKHLNANEPVLYDLSSSYFEGHTCPLAKHGYSRDHRGDLPQVNYGLYCAQDGTPVAVDVLPGNEGDRVAFPKAVERIHSEFGMDDVIFIGDRGMIGGKVIDEVLRPTAGAQWITALANSSIARLERQGAIQTTWFDEQDLMRFSHPDYPDEILVACRNPLLAEERRRKRNALLDDTDALLEKVRLRVIRPQRPLRGRDRIGIEVGKVIGRKKMAKHYDIEIGEDSFIYRRNEERICAEANLDGIYIIRTSVSEERMSAEDTVRHYKQLASVERAFRSFKSIDVRVRPIHHRLEQRVRAHIFICMLAYYVEHHMRQRLAPILFHDQETQDDQRTSIVAPATRSEAATKKDETRLSPEGWPIASFRDVLDTLNGIVQAQASFAGYDRHPFPVVSKPSPYQSHILDLLGIKKLV